MRNYKTINGFTVASMKEVILREYKGQAVSELSGNCMYLTENGEKCAVGCFIPDGHLSTGYRGGAFGLLMEYPDLRKDMPLTEGGLESFQQFHDVRPRTMQEMLDWIEENVENGGSL